MAREHPDLPEVSWLELEILNRLLTRERYGNELLMLLMNTLGKDKVTSGKLYPNLKKMEKAGFIRRLKKRKKEVTDEHGGVAVLPRGVDRIYFEITEKGKDEIDKAEMFIANIQFNRMLFQLDALVTNRFKEILSPLKGFKNIGILTGSDTFSIRRSLKIVPNLETKKYFLLMIEEGKDQKHYDFKEYLDREMAYFPSRIDDIPLKNDYLDVVVSTYDLTKEMNIKKYLAEVIRIVKQGGLVIIVEFAQFNSFILERIFSQNLYPGDEKKFIGQSGERIARLMEEKLENVSVERIKEQFIVKATKK
ncbi:MAG: helix-turn-helix transcriptional regulator [Thermoplasmatota archaeon]